MPLPELLVPARVVCELDPASELTCPRTLPVELLGVALFVDDLVLEEIACAVTLPRLADTVLPELLVPALVDCELELTSELACPRTLPAELLGVALVVDDPVLEETNCAVTLPRLAGPVLLKLLDPALVDCELELTSELTCPRTLPEELLIRPVLLVCEAAAVKTPPLELLSRAVPVGDPRLDEADCPRTLPLALLTVAPLVCELLGGAELGCPKTSPVPVLLPLGVGDRSTGELEERAAVTEPERLFTMLLLDPSPLLVCEAREPAEVGCPRAPPPPVLLDPDLADPVLEDDGLLLVCEVGEALLDVGLGLVGADVLERWELIWTVGAELCLLVLELVGTRDVVPGTGVEMESVQNPPLRPQSTLVATY